MKPRFFRCLVLLTGACLFGQTAFGGVIYDESISGDLSNSGLTPTLLPFLPGINQLFGTTGRTTAVDRDYFTFTVPTGFVLSSIILAPGTQTSGPLGDSFIGLEAGPQVTVSPTATDATGLLGWFHYDAGDIGTNILPLMGTAGQGATGFVPPLPAGTYSFWVQELSPGLVPYGFDIVVAPEPGTWTLLLGGAALLWVFRGRTHGIMKE